MRGDVARRRLGRLRELPLQRATVQHRAAPAPQPGGVLPGGDGSPHQRSTCIDSLVSEPLTADDALERASDAGIHLLRIPTPFAVGRVNTYLIEDDPLTLVDSGP